MFDTPPAPPPLPVAPPTVRLQRQSTIFRDGARLVVEPGASLPDRCVKCNAPAEGFTKRFNLSWHHPAIYFTILAGVLIYVIVALIVRKTARINIPLCPRHRAKRRNIILIGLGVFLLGIVGFFTAAALDNGWYVLVGFVLFIGGIITMVVGSQTVTPALINERAAWLKGVCPDFLAELPEWVE